MKKVMFLAALLLAAACGPKTYLGELDSPVGNWKSSESIYYFNGEIVFQNNACEYSAISFYQDSLCCIEGRKGAFQYYVSSDSLVVDSVAWHIEEMTGRFLKLQYLEDFRLKEAPEDDSSVPSPSSEQSARQTGVSPDNEETTDDGPVKLPVEYKGMTIISDGKDGYAYSGTSGVLVPCRYYGHTEEDGSLIIDCWFDSRHDTYKPF